MGAVNGVLVVFNPTALVHPDPGHGDAIYGLTQMLSRRYRAGRRCRRVSVPLQTNASAMCVAAGAAVLRAVGCRSRVGRAQDAPGRQIYLIGVRNREAGVPIAAVTLDLLHYPALAGPGRPAVLARSGVSSTFTGRGFQTLTPWRAIVSGGTGCSEARHTVFGTVVGVLVLFIAFNLVNLLGLDYNLQLVLGGHHLASAAMRGSDKIARTFPALEGI